MEHLAAALKQSLSQNQELQGRLLATIDKLADGLAAANRQAMHPIGKRFASLIRTKRRQAFLPISYSRNTLSKPKNK